jgi:hypothetical protein
MEVSDGELFESALSNEQPEVTVEQTTTEGEGVARDEQGRFAKSETVEPPKAEVEQAKPVETKEEAQVPSWRLRELRERAEAAETRARTIEQQLLALQPKPEPQAKPDIFEKPDEFVRSNVQEAISPLEKQFSEYREAMSQRGNGSVQNSGSGGQGRRSASRWQSFRRSSNRWTPSGIS